MATKIRAKRVRRSPRAIKFVVLWDDARQKFVALDDAKGLLGTSPMKAHAIGIARTGAMNAARSRAVQVAVMVETDGKQREEYVFEPPVTPPK